MEYIEGLRTLVERSPAFRGRNVSVTVIANPVAGGFTIKKRARLNLAHFNAALELVKDRPVLAESCSISLHLTAAAGHARQLARSALDLALAETDPRVLFLIITAGGDGTSLEVQTALASAVFRDRSDILTSRVCLLRLPFGTGNDGSDGRILEESLRLLTGPAHFALQRAVRVYASNKKDSPWYAFNIASIGLDAFVTHMTNRVKNLMPGDSYKVWVDIACVFYNRIYRIGEMRAKAYAADGTVVMDHTDQMALYVMGASGFRTYGSNQKILPDANNVCGIREMPLLRKLALKPHILAGSHASIPEVVLYSADSIIFEYNEKILVQLDGEAHLLEAADFPLVMELTAPFITVLRAD